jgi:hypothetical protein
LVQQFDASRKACYFTENCQMIPGIEEESKMLLRVLTLAFVAFVSLRGSVANAAAQTEKVDVTGTWAFTVLSDAGTGTPTVTLKQDGEKLTGHYSSMLVGEADLTGTVKGQAIEFTVRADVQGMPIEFKFTGTIESKDSMKGKLDTGGLGDATFTGKRKEPEAKKP